MNASESINVALIGFGRIAERHVAAISEVEGLRIAAVVDTDASRRLKAQDQGFRVFESVEKMFLEVDDLNLISVLTPSGTHFSLAMDLVKYKIPIVLEKPLTLSYLEALKLVRACASENVPLFVVKQNRLNSPVKKMLDRLNSGAFGDVLFASASVIWARDQNYYLQDAWRLSRRMDGGVIWNQASHYVDLLVQVAGRIQSVFAYGQNFLSPAETEDTVFAVLKAESGSLLSIQATTTARPSNFEGTLTVSSSQGLMKVGGHALNRLEADSFTIMASKFVATREEGGNVSEVYGTSHAGVYREILDDLRGVNPSQFRGEAGLHVIALMEAIHESISQGREVQISEIESVGDET